MLAVYKAISWLIVICHTPLHCLLLFLCLALSPSAYGAGPEDGFFGKSIDRFKYCSLSWQSARAPDDFRGWNLKSKDKDSENKGKGRGGMSGELRVDDKARRSKRDAEERKLCKKGLQIHVMICSKRLIHLLHRQLSDWRNTSTPRFFTKRSWLNHQWNRLTSVLGKRSKSVHIKVMTTWHMATTCISATSYRFQRSFKQLKSIHCWILGQWWINSETMVLSYVPNRNNKAFCCSDSCLWRASFPWQRWLELMGIVVLLSVWHPWCQIILVVIAAIYMIIISELKNTENFLPWSFYSFRALQCIL